MRRDIWRHAHRNTGGAVQQDAFGRRAGNIFGSRIVPSKFGTQSAAVLAPARLTAARRIWTGEIRYNALPRMTSIRRALPVPPPRPAGNGGKRTAAPSAPWLLIAGAVAMRVILTQYVTNGTGGFKFSAGVQPILTSHRRCGAVSLSGRRHKRQRTIHDHVHGVV